MYIMLQFFLKKILIKDLVEYKGIYESPRNNLSLLEFNLKIFLILL